MRGCCPFPCALWGALSRMAETWVFLHVLMQPKEAEQAKDATDAVTPEPAAAGADKGAEAKEKPAEGEAAKPVTGVSRRGCSAGHVCVCSGGCRERSCMG